MNNCQFDKITPKKYFFSLKKNSKKKNPYLHLGKFKHFDQPNLIEDDLENLLGNPHSLTEKTSSSSLSHLASLRG
jgi:hypothetical protein